jgi:hypothetical protein
MATNWPCRTVKLTELTVSTASALAAAIDLVDFRDFAVPLVVDRRHAPLPERRSPRNRHARNSERIRAGAGGQGVALQDGEPFDAAATSALAMPSRSSARATRSALLSRHGAATICTPIGSSPGARSGTATVGKPMNESGCV